jgi:Transposase DDE domain
MTAAEGGYEQARAGVKGRLEQTHATVVQTIAGAVLCVLLAQRVTPAAVARALPAEQGGRGRARLTRVRRWWVGPAVDQAEGSPQLIADALALLAPGQAIVVALDTTRLGKWEVWLAGIVVAGRTVPIGWAAMPYPWPKGRFRRTTLTLIQRLQTAFPMEVRWSLVADRGFPRAALFAQLRQGGTDFRVRVRLREWVTVAGVYAKVADHVVAGRLCQGRRPAATIGRGRPAQPLVSGWIAVSATRASLPRHKQNPGTLRERARRAKAQAHHRTHKQGRKTPPPSTVAQRYAQTWVLFTTVPTVRQAVRGYAQRMPIEETFRDWHHGWGVRAVVRRLPTEALAERLIAVICLAYTLQRYLGHRLSADPAGRERRAQWTVTDRVSWFWCGQRLFSDPGYDWGAWLAAQWPSLTRVQPLAHTRMIPLPLLAEAA